MIIIFYPDSPLASMTPATLRGGVAWVTSRGIPFLLSYARANANSAQPGAARHSDQMAERLFYDLTENLGQLIVLPTGAAYAFFDRRMPCCPQLLPHLP